MLRDDELRLEDIYHPQQLLMNGQGQNLFIRHHLTNRQILT